MSKFLEVAIIKQDLFKNLPDAKFDSLLFWKIDSSPASHR
jgi:hypothetical protein